MQEPHKQRLWSMLMRQKAEDSMGATNKSALRVTFDSRVKLEFHGSKVTSDAGLLVYRELDEALELTERSGGLLDDWRTGKNAQHLFGSRHTLLASLFRGHRRCLVQS